MLFQKINKIKTNSILEKKWAKWFWERENSKPEISNNKDIVQINNKNRCYYKTTNVKTA